MTVKLGLFDILQVDPLEQADHTEIYRRRLDDLAYADTLGFDIAFVAERHYMRHYRTPSPVAWLGAATQRTSAMRLGVLAFTLPLHSPARLAEDVAVLDQLSKGRIEVGVGLGHRKEELIANGIDPVNRISIFQERLAIMEALWSGAQVTLESGHTTVKEVEISPLPVQDPYPPLWFAGTEQNAAMWAGNHGMSLAVGFAPLEALLPAVAGFEAGRTARLNDNPELAEHPGAGRIALMQHVYVAESDEQAFAEMRSDLDRLTALNPGNLELSSGERAQLVEAELEVILRSERMLAGGPETVARGIEFARSMLGIDLFLANVYVAGADDTRVRRSMRLLSTDVRKILEQPAGKVSVESND